MPTGRELVLQKIHRPPVIALRRRAGRLRRLRHTSQLSLAAPHRQASCAIDAVDPFQIHRVTGALDQDGEPAVAAASALGREGHELGAPQSPEEIAQIAEALNAGALDDDEHALMIELAAALRELC
jgi:hypothetical protein